MPKPNFFIVGAPKCGTTAMYTYLRQHPDIYMPDAKIEPHFFATDLHIPMRAQYRDEATYLSLFAEATTEMMIGEASTWYLFSKVAARDIKAYAPSARIIIMLRDPVEMLYSLHSQMLVGSDETIQDFGKALAAEAERKAGRRRVRTYFVPREALYYSTVPRYSEQVRRYFDVFGREHVHVIIFDDFKADTSGVYRDTLAFLGVGTDFTPEFTVENPNVRVKNRIIYNFFTLWTPRWYTAYAVPVARAIIPQFARDMVNNYIKNRIVEVVPRQPLDAAVRDRLIEQFRPEVEALGNLLHRDLSFWSREQSNN